MGERVDLRRVSVHPRETFDDDRTAVGSLGTTETMAAGGKVSEGKRSRQASVGSSRGD